MIGNPRIDIIGDASVAAPYVEWAKPRWRALTDDGSRWYFFDDCIIQLFKAEEAGFIRIIAEGGHGIIFSPRSGDLVDTPFYYGVVDENGDDVLDYTPAVVGSGWEPDGKDEDGQKKFNLVPYTREDVFPDTVGKGNAVIYSQTRDTELPSLMLSAFSFAKQKSNYGNLFWEYQSALNPERNAAYVVSWKATPTIHFRDTTKQYDETFSNSVFINGKIITAPGYVLGATYSNGIIFAILYVRSEVEGVPAKLAGYSYQQGEWYEAHTEDDVFSMGYCGLPWFPSDGGTRFCETRTGTTANFVYKGRSPEDIHYYSVEKRSYPLDNQGEQEEKADLSYTKTYSGTDYFEMGHDGIGEDGIVQLGEPNGCRIEFTQNITRTISGDSASNEQEFDLSSEVVRDSRGGIQGDLYILAGSFYSLSNVVASHCDVNWTAPGAFTKSEDGGSIVMDSVTSCGTGQVTATLVGGENDGQMWSMDVLLPTGTWVFDHCEGSPCTSAWPPYSPCYCIIESMGGTFKTIEYYSNITTIISCSDYPPNPGKSCPEGWTDARSYNFTACYGDAGFTGGCCACHKYDFTTFYRWVCP